MHPSKVIDDKCIDLVRDVLETVNHLLQVIVQFGPDDEAHRSALRVPLPIGEKQRLATLIVKMIGLLLDADDLLGENVEVIGACAILVDVYPKSRYPEAGMPSVTEAHEAVAAARTVRAAVASRLSTWA